MTMIDSFYEATGWRNRIHLDYWMAIHSVINPGGGKKVGVYPCSGADALAFFLTTDAETGYFIDCIAFFDRETGNSLPPAVDRTCYWEHKEAGGNLGGGFSWTILLQSTGNLAIPLRWELEAMGAENISIVRVEEDVHIIDFRWAYPGDDDKRARSIVFFSGVDARFPLKYPERLKAFLANGIDLYIEKAAKDHFARYNAPLDWDDRWQQFNSYTVFNSDGIIITTQVPEDSNGFDLIEDSILTDLERNGAKFGVWPAVLLKAG